MCKIIKIYDMKDITSLLPQRVNYYVAITGVITILYIQLLIAFTFLQLD